jgi:hypothetical protein
MRELITDKGEGGVRVNYFSLVHAAAKPRGTFSCGGGKSTPLSVITIYIYIFIYLYINHPYPALRSTRKGLRWPNSYNYKHGLGQYFDQVTDLLVCNCL